MEPPRVHITTYGCQMNQLDAELVAEVLRASGARLETDAEEADVLLLLTCSVRGHAEDRVFSNVGAIKTRKQREPGLVVGLLGCMAQQYGPALRRRAPLVDLVCAPGRLAELPDLIAQARSGKVAIALDPVRGEASAQQSGRLTVTSNPQSATLLRPPKQPAGCEERVRNPQFSFSDAALDQAEVRRPLCGSSPGQAYVVAVRGCDNFCSYCVVPHVRGPERSRAPSAILDEVRRLVGQGARQITFLGQAVNQYAAVEVGRRWDLADLLQAAAETPDLARLAFITNHPRAFDERLAALFREVPKVCPYLHMPAQSGSDAVLARMNRGYTAAEYLERVAMARRARPDVGVASDFIVGFPGETAADFEATMDLVRRSRFSAAFVFKYSPRPKTVAAERYSDDVPMDEKRRRHARLLALVEEISGEENAKFVGRRVRIFVEEVSPKAGANSKSETLLRPPKQPAGCEERVRNPKSLQLRGRTPCNRIVVFDGPARLVGTEVAARIEKVSPLTLFGSLETPSATRA